MKTKLLLWTLVLGLWALPATAITPFYIKLLNATNAAMPVSIGVSQITPSTAINSSFSTYGTNLIFGGNSTSNFTITLDATGFSSNAIYPGTWKFAFTNLGSSFIAVIPDTTNYQSLALYVTNLQVFSGVSQSGAAVITNLLGYIPANAANTNDFVRNSLAGIAGAQGYTSKTNDGNIGLWSGSVISLATNGFQVWAAYQTNAAPGPQLTNLPSGSIMSTTNGQMYVLSNLVWNLK